MKQIERNDSVAQSADVVAQNIEALKSLFPDAVVEGKIDLAVIKELIGESLLPEEERDEKYGLNWFGKRKARQIALTPSTGTLRPCPEDSVDWDTTKNLMIEGDNLEVLKILLKSYAGKVKLIYIDPPYNTGKDFVYPDNFQDNIKNYLELTGQIEGGAKMQANTESSGRYHTDWLNMMYPRLKLARNLLKEDGAIFISIDDTEVDSAKRMCSEIFGEDNFVCTIIWEKKYAPANDAKWLSDNHDFILLFAKNKTIWRPNLLPRTEEANARYSNPDNDPRGDWKPSGLDVKTYSSIYDYEITTPNGRKVNPPSGACWRVSKERLNELIADNRIWFGKDGSNVPSIKRFLEEVKQGITPLTIWKYEEVGHSQEATQEVRSLGVNGFDSPKPVRLLSRVIQIGAGNNDIVMDFFAGSGTTAHSVMKLNAEDCGNRKFVLVQLPEPLKTGNNDQRVAVDFCKEIGKKFTISELTKERLRRAGKKIKEENPLFTGDLGFRVFKLDTSNIRPWEPDWDNLDEMIKHSVNHIKDDRSEKDILYELLLKLGLDLSIPIEEKKIGSKKVQAIGAGTLMVCLDKSISRSDAEPLALGIIEWHKQLAPVGETTCVFLDSAFADDVAKSNLSAILQQHGLENVRSL